MYLLSHRTAQPEQTTTRVYEPRWGLLLSLLLISDRLLCLETPTDFQDPGQAFPPLGSPAHFIPPAPHTGPAASSQAHGSAKGVPLASKLRNVYGGTDAERFLSSFFSFVFICYLVSVQAPKIKKKIITFTYFRERERERAGEGQTEGELEDLKWG